MKYMLYDFDAQNDESYESGTAFATCFATFGTALSFAATVYLTYEYVFNSKGSIFWILLVLALLLFYFTGTIACLWELRKYELTDKGIKYKWLFRRGIVKWEDIVCYGFLPSTVYEEDRRWYIAVFLATCSPRYPLDINNLKDAYSKPTILEIRKSEKRVAEFKQYADAHNVPFIGKEGNGERYAYSTWFNDFGGKNTGVQTNPSGMRLIKGTDNPSSDRVHKMTYVYLAFLMVAAVVFGLSMFVKSFIENPNSLGAVVLLIIVIAGIGTIPRLLEQNNTYRLQKDGLYIKSPFGHRLVRWQDVKYCSVVFAGFARGIVGGYILVSLEKKPPRKNIDMDTNYFFHGSNQILITSTYSRIEEFKNWADSHGIPWDDIYDEDGKKIVPEKDTRVDNK